MATRGKRGPEDVNETAFRVFSEAIKDSDTEDTPVVAARRLGGRRRAEKLTPEQRQDIARVAAQARWKKSD